MLPLERNIGPLMLKTIEGNLRKGHNRGYVSAIFVFITLTTLLIFHQIVFNMLTLSVQKSEALEYKNFLSSAPSSQFNTSDSNSCTNYNPSTRTITVSCGNSARLTDIYNKLHDNSVLTKQSPIGTWLLSANLIISKGSTFHIDSTEKVRSSEPKIGPAYNIDVLGSLKIDSALSEWIACLLTLTSVIPILGPGHIPPVFISTNLA
jgi:hypothetical protein